MGMGGGGGGQDMGPMYQMMEAAQARQMEDFRQQQIKTGRDQINQNFSGLLNNPAFTARYGQAVRDYQKPQIDQQYANANKELTYRLADAGTTRSSGAADATSNLVAQKDMNYANMNRAADNAEASLLNRVNSEKNTAINQLYATNDPNQALTTALNSIGSVQVAQPDLQPLANIFNIGTIGAANAIKAFQGGGGGMQQTAGTTPSAPGFSDSGKNVGSFLS